MAKAKRAREPAGGKEAAKCRRWKRELMVASKREKDWRESGDKIVKRYRAEERRKNAFNVLWSNTEVLRPALYNSKPDPDVRRRFRDADPLGKAVGEVLERALCVTVDGDSTDNALKNDVLDGLLPGRGVSRVRYIPKLAPVGATAPNPTPNADGPGAAANDGVGGSNPPEPNEESLEQVEDEQVIIEHVDWHDFRHGFGRVWAEVTWVGFRHKLTRDDATDKFGEEAITDVVFALPLVEDEKKYHQEAAETTKVAEFWEIWDKEGEEVFFLNENVKVLLYPTANPDGAPPIDFEGFFPCPEPLTIIENTGSLIPIAMFSLYENQANQLDKITARIDKIVAALRLRGVYDGKVAELRDLMQNDDNEMTPIQNAQQWADAGGLEKAIAWMPVDMAATVLGALYDARARQKAIIDELIGIADIVRGATDPDETLGAQKLKSNYYSVRLTRMQNAVKRYARDLIRLAAQVMTNRFGADTFASMTNLKFPTRVEKQALQAKLMLLQQPQALHTPPQPQPGPSGPMGASPGQSPGAAMPGAPGAPPPVGAGPPPAPPPELLQALQLPTWEDIIGLMRSPALRQFRVDVETDSMIAATLESDMSGLAEVLKGVTELLTGLAPLVQTGALPAEAGKELVMAVIRRARLGSVVEDAFDKMTAPKPPSQPQNTDLQEAQVAAQAQQQIAQVEAQGRQQLEAMRQQGETQRQQLEDANRVQRESMLEHMKTDREVLMAKFDAFVKIITATISATKQPDPQVQPRADAVVGGNALEAA